jgi:hypothetical protein
MWSSPSTSSDPPLNRFSAIIGAGRARPHHPAGMKSGDKMFAAAVVTPLA